MSVPKKASSFDKQRKMCGSLNNDSTCALSFTLVVWLNYLVLQKCAYSQKKPSHLELQRCSEPLVALKGEIESSRTSP